MTYCVALRLNAGLVFLSDSRTNAGVDQIGTFRKMTVFERAGERCMVLLTSGNLGVTQSVRQLVMEPGEGANVWSAPSMHDEAAKCSLVSMDSTLRSNLSVGLPLDLLCYEADSLRVTRFVTIGPDNEYFQMVSRTWGRRLKQAFVELPDPTWAGAGTSQPVRAVVPAGLQPPGRKPAASIQAFAETPAPSPPDPGGPRG